MSQHDSIARRARHYLAALPPAIAGSGGHHATFCAALALVRGFALPEKEAAPLLAEWNLTHADPHWSPNELQRKLRDAARASLPMGYLLGEGPQNEKSSRETEAETRARHRREWPVFRRLSADELRSIATLRGLPFESVALAQSNGLLSGAVVDGHPSFVLHEGRLAQARRMDGEPFTRTDGSRIKAKNLRGSQGVALGRCALGETPPVLLVEGCVGWLEAVAAIWTADRFDWTALAAVSASARLSNDPTLLSKLANRRVRIVPDNDEHGQGLRAAAIWTAELRNAGAQVDAFTLPAGIKDLGHLLTTHDPAILTELFAT